MYDGHTCGEHHNHTVTAQLPDVEALIARQIRRVYLERLKAGDIDADLWKATTDDLWKAIKEGWGRAPKFFEKGQLSQLELRRNVNVFSAFKNHSNVIELAQLLTGPNGEKVTFSQFRKLARPISEKYNINWLRAEHDYAQKAARAAAQWDSFEQRGGKLQYRTVGDGRVREAHALLEGTTLPVSHPFWTLYYPPNGWNCRCFVRWQPDDTPDVAPSATPEVNQMFQNNVGETSQIFTEDHPFIREISPDQAERIRQIAQEETEKWERKHLYPLMKQSRDRATTATFGDTTREVSITNRSIKKALSQPHANMFERNRALLNLESLISDATYVTSAANSKTNWQVIRFHYLLTEVAGQPSYIVIRETKEGMFFYSIVDKLKE